MAFRSTRSPLSSKSELMRQFIVKKSSFSGPGSRTPPTPPRSSLSPVPKADPISRDDLDWLENFFLDHNRVAVLTGAGVSTESNIPDYRGPKGAYSTGFKPMSHQQFMASDENRSRYWARSFVGWHEFTSVKPNAAHEVIARLQSMGYISDIITQNVDRLHQRAGASNVLELHGTTHEVTCMGCGRVSCRKELQHKLAGLNPEMAELADRVAKTTSERAKFGRALRIGTAADARAMKGGSLEEKPLQSWQVSNGNGNGNGIANGNGNGNGNGHASPRQITPGGSSMDSRLVRGTGNGNEVLEAPEESGSEVGLQRPDGDVELGAALTSSFQVPPCDMCGGVLKPNVTFFGDNLAPERRERAESIVASSDALLVIGSSLMVFSAFRLAQQAKDAGKPLVVMTVGETRADPILTRKLPYVAGEALSRLVQRPGVQLPKIGGSSLTGFNSSSGFYG